MSTTASDGSILLEKEDGPEDEAVELAGEEIAGTRDSPGNSNCCASASASALASEAPAVVEAAAGRLRGRKTRHLFWYPIGMLGLAALSIAQKIGYVDLPLGFGSPQPVAAERGGSYTVHSIVTAGAPPPPPAPTGTHS